MESLLRLGTPQICKTLWAETGSSLPFLNESQVASSGGFPLRQECEARAERDLPSFHALLCIPSHAHHSLSSIIMCLQECPVTLKKRLSQDESFHLNWAPRRKEKYLVVPENTVHIYVLFGILSVVQPCVFVQSLCLHLWPVSHCVLSPTRMQRLGRRRCPWGPLDQSLQGCDHGGWEQLWFPHWSQSYEEPAHKAQRNEVCSSIDLWGLLASGFL